MTKVRALVGVNGQPLPVLPPDRDPRVWARLVRVMFYTPGFMAILLIKTGEPAGFGISVELLMLASASAIVAGLFIGTQSAAGGATAASRVGTWSGALVLELLATVPFLCALPSLFHELATSNLLHAAAPTAIDTSLGASELLPIVAIVPFVVYRARWIRYAALRADEGGELGGQHRDRRADHHELHREPVPAISRWSGSSWACSC